MMNLKDNQIGRFNLICRIRDLEFFESNGGGQGMYENRATICACSESYSKERLLRKKLPKILSFSILRTTITPPPKKAKIANNNRSFASPVTS